MDLLLLFLSRSLALCGRGGRVCLHPHPAHPHHCFCAHLEQELVSERLSITKTKRAVVFVHRVMLQFGLRELKLLQHLQGLAGVSEVQLSQDLLQA